MADRVVQEEKCKPGIAFQLYIPITYNISLPNKIQKLLRQKFKSEKGRKNNISFIFRERFFKLFDVKDVIELLKSSPSIKRDCDTLHSTIRKEFENKNGIKFPREFSKLWYIQAEELLNEKK